MKKLFQIDDFGAGCFGLILAGGILLPLTAFAVKLFV